MEEIMATVAIPARRASEFRMLAGVKSQGSLSPFFQASRDERELWLLAAVALEAWVGCETSGAVACRMQSGSIELSCRRVLTRVRVFDSFDCTSLARAKDTSKRSHQPHIDHHSLHFSWNATASIPSSPFQKRLYTIAVPYRR